MPTNRRLVRRPRRGRLSDAAEMHLWLGSGLQECPHPFASDDERREAWLRNRERLMACFGNGGRRPMAWWAYDAPIPYPRRRRSLASPLGALQNCHAITQAQCHLAFRLVPPSQRSTCQPKR
jgi:hypothetical protein